MSKVTNNLHKYRAAADREFSEGDFVIILPSKLLKIGVVSIAFDSESGYARRFLLNDKGYMSIQ